MQIQIFNVPLADNGDSLSEMNRFLTGHKVLEVVIKKRLIAQKAKKATASNVKNDEDKFIFIKTQLINDKLELTIKDSGGGIPEKIIHRVFEPYFTTKHQSVGTGIGLSMVYKIITERHPSTITVENQEYQYNNKHYKGACFRIIFNGNS